MNNPWPSCLVRPRQGNEQFSNFVESSIKVFKSFETLLNDAKLFATDLLQRIDIIASCMNCRPVKIVTHSNSIFTLSAKELVMPLLSRASIRQNILHIGSQLCQATSWSDYSAYKSDSQQLLQQHLLSFLYSEASWKFNVMQKSNVSHDKHLLQPEINDIVAIKMHGEEDFKLGVVTSNKESPRIKVRTLTGGKLDQPLVHILNLGLMYRDPPNQTSDAVAADNDALKRAAIGLDKAWEGQPKYKITAERLKLKKIHESLIFEGLNLLSGQYEDYFITNLCSSNNMEEISFSNCTVYGEHNRKASRDKSHLAAKKINLFIDRFLSLTSSMIPMSDQRDVNEPCFKLLSFGINVPRPSKFCMPSVYLAHMLFEQDIRLYSTGELWTNRKCWKPANDFRSPIEVFPLSSILKALNPEHFQEIPVIADLIEEVSSEPSQLGDNVDHALPSTSKSSAHTPALADNVAKTTGTKRKCGKRKPKKQNNKITLVMTALHTCHHPIVCWPLVMSPQCLSVNYFHLILPPQVTSAC